MSQSLSSLERANPPPRRKSCTGCIKAKRRCDLGLPACQRCAQRKLECRYPMAPAAKKRPSRPKGPVDGDLVVPGSEPPLDTSPWTPQMQLTGNLDSPAPVTSILDSPSPPFDGNFSMLDYIIDSPGNTLDDILTMPMDPPSSQLELVPLPKSLIFPERRPNDVDSVASIISTRLQYAMDEIVKAPRTMVFENQTPWCHAHLYKDYMPRAMQDAHACCGLYTAKNKTNAAIILRTIEFRTQELVSSALPTTRLELLARTQALLLYQIIRLFDGDIRARVAAERTNAALDTAATALLGHISYDAESGAAPSGSLTAAARESWEDWVFQESARRTFLVVFFTLQLYRVLSRAGPLQCDPKLYVCHSCTLSAHLWRARDSLDFEIAWRERRHFVVTNADMLEVIRDARGDDVEAFGKILITALMGIDEAKRWLYLRGGIL